MPLVGLIDPSHDAAKSGGLGQLPPWLSVEQLLARAKNEPKYAPYTHEVLKSITDEFQERDYISSSALTASCPRGLVVQRKEDYIGDLADMYIPWFGTMVHKVLEDVADEETIPEARFWTDMGGIELSCSPDLLTKVVLYDYKFTQNPPQFNYPYVHHKEQVQLNAFIVRTHTRADRELPFDPREHVAKRVALVYLGPKYPKVLEVERTEDVFKNGKVRKSKQPFVGDDDYIKGLFGPRLETLARALEVYPQWPAGAEKLWGGEASWTCPGKPLCHLPNCLAKRRVLTW